MMKDKPRRSASALGKPVASKPRRPSSAVDGRASSALEGEWEGNLAQRSSMQKKDMQENSRCVPSVLKAEPTQKLQRPSSALEVVVTKSKQPSSAMEVAMKETPRRRQAADPKERRGQDKLKNSSSGAAIKKRGGKRSDRSDLLPRERQPAAGSNIEEVPAVVPALPPKWVLDASEQLSRGTPRSRCDAAIQFRERANEARPFAVFFGGALAVAAYQEPLGESTRSASEATLRNDPAFTYATVLAKERVASSSAETTVPCTATRRAAVEALEALGKSGGLGFYVDALAVAISSDRSPGVRLAAISAMGGAEDLAGVHARTLATSAVDDAEIIVRQSAACTLSHLGDDAQECIKELSAKLYDEDAVCRQRAAEALGAMGKAAKNAATDLAQVVMQDGFVGVRQAAARALGRLGDIIAMHHAQCFAEFLKNGDVTERKRAAAALGNVGNVAAAHAVLLLESAMEDNDDVVRLRAGEALGSMAEVAAHELDALVAGSLGHVDADMRRRAAEALGAAGSDAIGRQTSYIASKLNDDLVVARRHAAQALSVMGRAVTPHADAITRTLQHDIDAATRAAAAAALGQIGHSISEAHINVLSAALNDEHWMVRKSVTHALGALGGVGAPHSANFLVPSCRIAWTST